MSHLRSTITPPHLSKRSVQKYVRAGDASFAWANSPGTAEDQRAFLASPIRLCR